MTEPVWLTSKLVIAFHDVQLRQFGGPAGLRDPGMLDSALGRAINKWTYETAELPELAAAYAYGIARNHPFVDGNKRAAFLAVGMFLAVNGYRLQASQAEATLTVLAVAAGELEEAAFAAWLRAHIQPR